MRSKLAPAVQPGGTQQSDIPGQIVPATVLSSDGARNIQKNLRCFVLVEGNRRFPPTNLEKSNEQRPKESRPLRSARHHACRVVDGHVAGSQ
jgi:hypothetical protein